MQWHKGAMCHTLATVGMTPLHVLMVDKWAAGFKRAIGGLKYEYMPGDMSPSPQVRRHGLLDIIHDVIMSDRRETIRYNANELAISRDPFDVVIHNALQTPKVLDCWVPKLFLT